ITENIKNGSFNFQPGRRVHIPKANGKTRPLTIAPPRDKIVQVNMMIRLELLVLIEKISNYQILQI
ncbi:hypothetical protein ACQ1ZS_15005, partial [Enterococcus faecalis]